MDISLIQPLMSCAGVLWSAAQYITKHDKSSYLFGLLVVFVTCCSQVFSLPRTSRYHSNQWDVHVLIKYYVISLKSKLFKVYFECTSHHSEFYSHYCVQLVRCYFEEPPICSSKSTIRCFCFETHKIVRETALNQDDLTNSMIVCLL